MIGATFNNPLDDSFDRHGESTVRGINNSDGLLSQGGKIDTNEKILNGVKHVTQQVEDEPLDWDRAQV